MPFFVDELLPWLSESELACELINVAKLDRAKDDLADIKQEMKDFHDALVAHDSPIIVQGHPLFRQHHMVARNLYMFCQKYVDYKTYAYLGFAKQVAAELKMPDIPPNFDVDDLRACAVLYEQWILGNLELRRQISPDAFVHMLKRQRNPPQQPRNNQAALLDPSTPHAVQERETNKATAVEHQVIKEEEEEEQGEKEQEKEKEEEEKEKEGEKEQEEEEDDDSDDDDKVYNRQREEDNRNVAWFQCEECGSLQMSMRKASNVKNICIWCHVPNLPNRRQWCMLCKLEQPASEFCARYSSICEDCDLDDRGFVFDNFNCKQCKIKRGNNHADMSVSRWNKDKTEIRGTCVWCTGKASPPRLRWCPTHDNDVGAAIPETEFDDTISRFQYCLACTPRMEARKPLGTA